MGVNILSLNFVFFLFAILATKCQIPPEAVPPELKFVLDPELDSWKPPKELQAELPYYLSGYDEEKRPIWVVEMGGWPTRDILARGPEWEKAYSKYVDQMLKRAYDSIGFYATPEHPVLEFNMIIDVDNYTIRHFSSVKAVSFVTRKFQLVAGAAKLGHGMFVVNANAFAEIVLNFLRPILGSAMENVEVYGTNPEVWIPKLLKVLPKDQLSPRYGGEKDFKPLKVYG